MSRGAGVPPALLHQATVLGRGASILLANRNRGNHNICHRLLVKPMADASLKEPQMEPLSFRYFPIKDGGELDYSDRPGKVTMEELILGEDCSIPLKTLTAVKRVEDTLQIDYAEK